MKLLLIPALFIAFILTPCELSAQTLDSSTITTTYLFPDTGTIFAGPVDTVVPGTISFFAGFADVSFSSQNILITADRDAAINAVTFDGFEFSDPSVIFNTVTIDPSTNYGGLTSSNLTFTSHQIFLNLVGLPGLDGQKILLDVNGTASPTPECGTFLLFGSGLILALILSRKLL